MQTLGDKLNESLKKFAQEQGLTNDYGVNPETKEMNPVPEHVKKKLGYKSRTLMENIFKKFEKLTENIFAKLCDFSKRVFIDPSASAGQRLRERFGDTQARPTADEVTLSDMTADKVTLSGRFDEAADRSDTFNAEQSKVSDKNAREYL